MGVVCCGVAALAEPAVVFKADDANFSGKIMYSADKDCVDGWREPAARAQWNLSVTEDAEAYVRLLYSCAPKNGGTFLVEIGRQKLQGTVTPTGGWNKYQTLDLGPVKLAKGNYFVNIRPLEPLGLLMYLKEMTFSPLKGSGRTQPEHLPTTYLVPNFHPASCGWLVNWSVERNYCANNYLAHLDCVRDNPYYYFAMSECNNMIAIRDFQPKRFEELKQRIKEGRVELVNGFFLEPDINLSGGEALAKMGIEGLRWQQQVMGVRPRYCWAIDSVGIPAQMGQLCDQLGLEALVYVRCNPFGKRVYWTESPEGSRVLTLGVQSYASRLGGLMTADTRPPNRLLMWNFGREIAGMIPKIPAGAPALFLCGSSDYAAPPARPEKVTEFLQAWKEYRPACEVRFSGLSAYVDALTPGIRSGKFELATLSNTVGYAYSAFWANGPKLKSWFRRDEHALQAAEILATIASLKAGYEYPVQPFYHAWLQMLLNMDRNTIWAAAAGFVFEDPTSWDVRDRFEWVEKHSAASLQDAARKLAGAGSAVSVFNPVNWPRADALRMKLPVGTGLVGVTTEALGDGMTLCQLDVPSMGAMGCELTASPAPAPRTIALPATIETPYYSARIDPATGALVSLKSKPSGREMLGGPANVVVAEKDSGLGHGNRIDGRAQRQRWATSSDFKPAIAVTEGPLAITVTASSGFVGDGAMRRVTRFLKNHPRIEFETELNDIPALTVVVAEFPLAQAPAEVRRGVPFGFSRDDFAGIKGIAPAVRWSDYATPGQGGLALLDRGLPGREMTGATPILYLLNAVDKYAGYDPGWISGRGRHHLEYALVAHNQDWTAARIPQLAWEYNCPPMVATGCALIGPQSFLKTSDNLIVEAMRREGGDIELRLVEVVGQSGAATVELNLPHTAAAMTDMLGGRVRPLAGGPVYTFPVKPQQIVTLRFRMAHPVADIQPLLQWDELVPPAKRAALHEYNPKLHGHPPTGAEMVTDQGDTAAALVIKPKG